MSLSLGSNSRSKLPPKPLSELINNSSMIKEEQHPHISAPMSKIHQYFASSQFLSSQEQLSVFIENFPIINIESSHRSINEILPMLIRQNEMLAKKCQSQVLLIKESFSKHENISKQNKRLKQEVQNIRQQFKEVIRSKQAEVIQGFKLNEKLSTRLKTYSQFIMSHNQVLKSIVSNEFKRSQQLTNSRNIRIAYDDFLAQLRGMYQAKQQQLQQKCGIIETQEIVRLEQIQRYAKQNRKKCKYYSRVKCSVEQFCARLVKISLMVPGQMLSKELGYECSQFLGIINELISQGEGRKKREDSIAKKQQKQRQDYQAKLSSVNSDSSLFSKSQLDASNHKNNKLIKNKDMQNFQQRNYEISDKQQTLMLRSGWSSSFEGVLNSYLSQSTKKYEQRINELERELSQVREQYETSKEYYEGHLVNAKLEYEKERREWEQQITIKDEMVRHFEQELERCFALKQELEQRANILSKQNQEMKVRLNPLNQQIQQLSLQLKLNEEAIQKAILRNQALEESLSQQVTQKQIQLVQSTQKLQSKLRLKEQQHEQQLNKKFELIKQKDDSVSALSQEIRQLKQLVQDKNLEISRANKRLQAIQEDQVKKLQAQVQHVEQETAQTKKANRELHNNLQQLNQEILLNTAYTKELQSKLLHKDETIQKLNKKLALVQTQKKTLKPLKQTNQKLQTQLQTSSLQLKKTLQQNSTLKKLVKGMKKELEEVYHTINDLKSIEKDRERLILENQKSERWKQQIIKDYDQMKYDVLKVEAENKSLTLQLRHYKNALKRIQMIN